MRPTWTSPGRVRGPAWPCTGRGLPCASASPRRRCALTAPFHPCLCATHVRSRHRRSAFCGTFPRVSPGGRYPPPLPCGVRTFLEDSFRHLRDCLTRIREGTSVRRDRCKPAHRVVRGTRQESEEPQVAQPLRSSSP